MLPVALRRALPDASSRSRGELAYEDVALEIAASDCRGTEEPRMEVLPARIASSAATAVAEPDDWALARMADTLSLAESVFPRVKRLGSAHEGMIPAWTSDAAAQNEATSDARDRPDGVSARMPT
jgi:hypothetical protein